VRVDALSDALNDPTVAVILLDVVLGHGAHEDPSHAIVDTLTQHGTENSNARTPVVIASVCGTESDPQGLHSQCRALTNAGITVCNSNCGAAELAASVIQHIS